MRDGGARVRYAAPLAAATAALTSLAAIRPPQVGALICVGTDHVLRLESSGKCPAGTTPFSIGVVAASSDASQKASADDRAQIRDLKSRVADLERELDVLKADRGRVSSHVTAPFEVDDPQGKPIFVVGAAPRGFELRSPDGHPLIAATLNSEAGAAMKIQDDAGATQAIVAVSASKTPQFVLRSRGVRRALFYVAADTGVTNLLLLNQNEIPTVSITQSPTGAAGKLQLTDGDGTVMVKAGTTQNGKGMVVVGPEWKCVPSNMGLTMPDCILGHKP